MTSDELVVERTEIAKVFPHGDGFTFVDRLHVSRSGTTWAEWTPRATDTVVSQHFTGHDVVPGVILVETCAQVAGLACAVVEARAARERGLPEPGLEALAERWYVVTDVREAKFRRLVVAGTPLVVEPETPVGRKGIWTCALVVRERTSRLPVASVALRLAELSRGEVVARAVRAAAASRRTRGDG